VEVVEVVEVVEGEEYLQMVMSLAEEMDFRSIATDWPHVMEEGVVLGELVLGGRVGLILTLTMPYWSSRCVC
jgi:hypothetical protein